VKAVGGNFEAETFDTFQLKCCGKSMKVSMFRELALQFFGSENDMVRAPVAELPFCFFCQEKLKYEDLISAFSEYKSALYQKQLKVNSSI